MIIEIFLAISLDFQTKRWCVYIRFDYLIWQWTLQQQQQQQQQILLKIANIHVTNITIVYWMHFILRKSICRSKLIQNSNSDLLLLILLTTCRGRDKYIIWHNITREFSLVVPWQNGIKYQYIVIWSRSQISCGASERLCPQ